MRSTFLSRHTRLNISPAGALTPALSANLVLLPDDQQISEASQRLLRPLDIGLEVVLDARGDGAHEAAEHEAVVQHAVLLDEDLHEGDLARRLDAGLRDLAHGLQHRRPLLALAGLRDARQVLVAQDVARRLAQVLQQPVVVVWRAQLAQCWERTSSDRRS